MIHFLLLPIGFVLGFYIAANVARWKLEDLCKLHAKQLKAEKESEFIRGCGTRIHESRAPFTFNQP